MQTLNHLGQFHPRTCRSQSGFTVLELLVIVVIVAFVVAIAAPNMVHFWTAQQVTASQQEVYQGIQLAQHNAQRERIEWQFSIRDTGSRVEWAIHPQALPATKAAVWSTLDSAVLIDASNTTLASQSNIYYVRFGHRGEVTYRLGRITLASRYGGKTKRCVVVSTLLGAMRLGKENTKPDDNGRYCY